MGAQGGSASAGRSGLVRQSGGRDHGDAQINSASEAAPEDGAAEDLSAEFEEFWGAVFSGKSTVDLGEEGSKALASCGGESFTPATGVVLASGAVVPIDELKPGMSVEATDPKTGKTAAHTVQKVWVNHDDDLMDLTVKSGSASSVIHTTQHHLFWDDTTHTWVEADDLAPGDQLRTDDGTTVTSAGSRVIPGTADMWDLTVQGDHDFYVQTDTATAAPGVTPSVLVHNCPKWTGPTDPDEDDYPQASQPMKPRGEGMPNDVENRQAKAAANEVGLNDEQANTFHQEITGKNITSYQELVGIARRIADGEIH